MRTGPLERGGHLYTAIRSRFPCLLPAISSMTADRVRRAEIAGSTRKAVQAAGYTADSLVATVGIDTVRNVSPDAYVGQPLLALGLFRVGGCGRLVLGRSFIRGCQGCPALRASCRVPGRRRRRHGGVAVQIQHNRVRDRTELVPLEPRRLL